MHELGGLICAYGVTETNLHCQDAMQGRMMTMQAPYFFEHNRKLKANKIILRDQMKEN